MSVPGSVSTCTSRFAALNAAHAGPSYSCRISTRTRAGPAALPPESPPGAAAPPPHPAAAAAPATRDRAPPSSRRRRTGSRRSTLTALLSHPVMAEIDAGASGVDALFPQPDSPAGRLLGHLVALQVPGMPIEIALSSLAAATRLDPDVAANALSRLSADGLVQLETEPESEQLSVTVMLAPPLEEYGITPSWGEPVSAPPAAPPPAAPPPAASAPASPPQDTA